MWKIDKLEKILKSEVIIDDSLLSEIVYLVEYPTAFYGFFDKEFLALPEPVIITPMKDHQRYFPVFRNNKLQPYFIGVRNGDNHSLKTVRKGNERVLRARLKDVQFFYNDDLKKKLEDRVNELKYIVYQVKLGTVFDKVKRVQNLSNVIGEELKFSKEHMQKLNKAVYLCKADLTTNMVNEFDELQGIMGEIYALEDGENKDVARAIRSHYLPRYSNDDVPRDDIGIAISIADKIDSITGFFSLGFKPKGSHDPFGLRRQAIGIVSTIIKNSLKIDLDYLFNVSINLFDNKIITNKEFLKLDVEQFFKQRLKIIFSESDFRYDLIDSVLDGKLNDLLALKEKLIILTSAIENDDFNKLIIALSRVYSISKNNKDEDYKINVNLFENDWEKNIYKLTEEIKKEVTEKIKKSEYDKAIEVLKKLICPINDFFDNVMVMTENIEIRNNRLALLKNVELLSKEICNFNKIIL